MVRRYEDPVQVRPVDEVSQEVGEPPASFLWHGRLYVVRSVLGHWRERRAWWTEPAARAVHGDMVGGATAGMAGDVAGTAAAVRSAGTAAVRSAGTPDIPPPGTRLALSDEREVWRVEAGCGQAAGLGVYDLCLDPGRSWSLLRVGD
jgi:hypothetical protein